MVFFRAELYIHIYGELYLYMIYYISIQEQQQQQQKEHTVFLYIERKQQK